MDTAAGPALAALLQCSRKCVDELGTGLLDHQP
jgi:hypothetical protein